MEGGTRIAIGVGIGYVLGRTRKMRFALGLAGAAMARRSSGTPGELMKFGTSLVKSSPELSQLTDTVRGELLGAVRSAAVAAASSRIDALNDRLQQGPTLVADEDDAAETDSSDDDYDEPDRDDEEAAADQDEDLEDDTAQPAPRARARRSSGTAARKTASRAADRRSGSADRKPPSSTRRRSRADTDEAPVRRTKR
ncbi:hypothetical protein [Nocardia fluminea]|uniref:DNA primase n=1 Tax=Nocardia fluminea TaxID=134984 RepID=A0A2N3VJQ7_9NOCA|nr:hypothetical protein [Nocardia fluminea]PKV81844.1 hypothetical protein ATK86_6316 [Nocardia fluminea]